MAELARMHRQAVRWIAAVAVSVAFAVYIVLSAVVATMQEVRATREALMALDSATLHSLKEAKDSGAIQRTRLNQRVDSLVRTRPRRSR